MADRDSAATSRRQIILIGSAALGGALLLFLLWYLLLRTPFAPAFTGINSTDALTITQELDRLKTPYELADDGTTILVPQDKVDEARVSILGSELPLKGAVGFELFNKTDMGLTEFAQKINYQRALQGELARTIMALDQIETARVHLSLPEEGIFEQDRRAAKASITVATKIGGTIDGNVVRGIQQLVAAAVPDLQAANVAILDARGQLLSPEISSLIVVAETPAQQRRMAFEQGLASKIEDSVRAVGLAMPMKVKVTALRDFTEEADAVADAASLGDGEGAAPAISERRDNPLNVQLQLAAMPGSAVQDKLLTAAREAIGYDQPLGDVVSIQINPMVGDWSADQGTKNAVQQGPPAPSTSSAFAGIPLWPIFLALGVLALFIIVWLFRGRINASLSTDEKQAFADRLKSLLEEEARNGRTTA
jgi:flagellar M-ring protein FliF